MYFELLVITIQLKRFCALNMQHNDQIQKQEF